MSTKAKSAGLAVGSKIVTGGQLVVTVVQGSASNVKDFFSGMKLAFTSPKTEVRGARKPRAKGTSKK